MSHLVPTPPPASIRQRHQLLQPLIDGYLVSLETKGRHRTARTRWYELRDLLTWLNREGVADPKAATHELLSAYQEHLASTYRTRTGFGLARQTQLVRLITLKNFYHWLELRGEIYANPTRRLKLRVPRQRTVVRDHLSLQEASALAQAASAMIRDEREGTHRWAIAVRDLAMVCIALATGRRAGGLVDMKLTNIDLDLRELRVEWEKGHVGRELPFATWAVEPIRLYIEKARPRLVSACTPPWLFIGLKPDQPMCECLFRYTVKRVVARTIRDNPDLTELPAKRISPHSLRVTYSSFLFKGGADIKVIGDLMLHRSLDTTQLYTPVPVEDLRQACRRFHPRV